MGNEGSPWSTLIIRAWVNEEGALRARLTEVDDDDNSDRSVAVAADAEAVISAIEAWLARVQGGPLQ
jgi:hypothetical protein